MEYEMLIAWLKENLIERSSINYKYDTAAIRLAFEYATKLYVSNDDVNNAMVKLGYRPAGHSNDPYLNFNLSSQSPALIIYQTKVLGAH